MLPRQNQFQICIARYVLPIWRDELGESVGMLLTNKHWLSQNTSSFCGGTIWLPPFLLNQFPMSAHHGICWILSVDLGERQIGFAFHQEIFSKTSKLSKGGKSWQIGELLFRLFPVCLPGVPYWARSQESKGFDWADAFNKSWKSWNEQEAEVGEELKALSTGCKESIWRKKNIT